MKFTRRRVLGALGVGAAVAGGARMGLPRLLRRPPGRPLSGTAGDFAAAALVGVERSRIWDLHAHLVGLPGCGHGCDVNPDFDSVFHPWKSLQFDIYLAAAGITDEARADEQYVDRLVRLHRLANPQGRLLLLAFDRFVDPQGQERPERSEFFTPNERVFEVAGTHPDVFVPCASVHPYRRDAIDRLERAWDAGARAMKWLPNAMGIDPMAPRCDPFYRRLAEMDLPLLSHTGREQAVDAGPDQDLGNPLRLRRALDTGVRVIAAHCASSGNDDDLDARPDGSGRRPRVASFRLFLRMMRARRYRENLFGDISAVTQTNRCGAPLRALLSARELHPRLLYASDYPLPAVSPLINVGKLQRLGYITADERAAIDEIDAANPLLADLVLKRTLAVEIEGQRVRLPPAAFETARLFGG